MRSARKNALLLSFHQRRIFRGMGRLGVDRGGVRALTLSASTIDLLAHGVELSDICDMPASFSFNVAA